MCVESFPIPNHVCPTFEQTRSSCDHFLSSALVRRNVMADRGDVMWSEAIDCNDSNVVHTHREGGYRDGVHGDCTLRRAAVCESMESCLHCSPCGGVLPPVLYMVFIASVLDHVYRTPLSETNTVVLGTGLDAAGLERPVVCRRPGGWPGSARGLRCLIDAVREHSLCGGWTLSVLKSHVVIFGCKPARACTSQFRWGPHQLT